MDKEVRIEQYKAELDWIDTHLFENIDTVATRKFIKTKNTIEVKRLLRICELRDKEKQIKNKRVARYWL